MPMYIETMKKLTWVYSCHPCEKPDRNGFYANYKLFSSNETAMIEHPS